VASKEPGWPQWRGPRRNGACDETGLLQSWPEGGPKLLWKAAGLGRGYSCPIITGGMLTITGDVGDELHIFGHFLDGKRKWTAKNGRSWKRSFPGARACVNVAAGRLYHMNAHGRVACLDAATGRELWAVNVLERFAASNIHWGISECLLVDGDRVIVTPGGKKALMAALDAKTGDTVWATAPLLFERTHRFGGARLPQPRREADKAGYAAPILFTLGGRRLIVNCSSRHVFCVDATTGKRLWHRPLPTQWEALGTTPVLIGDAVFATGPDGRGGILFRMRVDGEAVAVEEVWTSDMDTCHGGAIVVGDALYGSWYRHFNGWGALDLATGKTLFRTAALAMGSAIHADGRLYVLSQKGVMALLEPSRTGFATHGQFRLTRKGRRDVWTHPVILDRKLYLRYHDTLYCYDIRK